MNKFEKLIQLIVNEDNKQAKRLFHDIVVEKSRNIYESLLEDDEAEEIEEIEDEVEEVEEGLEAEITVAEAKQLLDHIDGTLKEADAGDLLQRVASHFGVTVEGLIPVLEANGDALLEMAYGEDEDEFGGEDEMGMDDGMDGEFDGGMDDGGEFAGDEMDAGIDGEMDMGGEEEIEDRVVDLEDAIDELKAEFDQLIGDDGMDDEFGGEEGGEEMDDTEDFAGDVASDDEGDDDLNDDDDELEESLVREYVEKVSAPSNSETSGTNHKDIVAGKNDMGGTTANILGSHNTEEGAGKIAAPKTHKGAPYQNDPKAKAGKTSFKKKETAKKADAPETKKSLLDGPKGKGVKGKK